jgi:hypothetical protein
MKQVAVLVIVALMVAACGAQEAAPPPPPPVCDNACLVASMDRLQVTLAEHNKLLAEQNRLSELLANPPPPPPLTKRQQTMKVVQTLGQFALVALPIIVKTAQQQNLIVKGK